MSDTTLTRKHALAAVCGIFAVALLYQIAKGWDTVDFLLRGIFSTAFAALIWRSGILVSRARPGRYALLAACWVAFAAILLFGVDVGR